jgi:hypothetical protein
MPARLGQAELEKQISSRLNALRRELAPNIPTERLTTLGRFHTERLLATATITDFVPLLVYRATKEDLLHGVSRARTLPTAA